LLEIFRKNYFINSILLLPYLFLVRVGLFTHERTIDFSDQSSLTKSIIYPWITNNYIEIITTNLIIFIQVLIINYMFLNHKLAKNSTLLAGLFYILFVSMIYPNTYLSDSLIANTFLIIALRNIWRTYKQTSINFRMFNIGFMIGLAALIYPPYFIILLFALISLYIIKSVRFLDFIQFLISFLVPFFLKSAYSYLTDKPVNPLSFLKEYQFTWVNFVFNSELINYIAIGLLILLMLISLFWYGDIMKRKNIEVQKKINTTYWLAFIILIAFFVFPKYDTEHLILLSVPLSILFGIKVSDSRSKITFELVHLLILGVIFISHFKLL